VRKPGHALIDIAADLPVRILEDLKKQFSITTAEELISANRISGGRLCESLAIDPSTWTKINDHVQTALPERELQRLTTALPARPGGVKLGKLSPEQVRQYAPGLTRQ
jgi:hypothetical protein